MSSVKIVEVGPRDGLQNITQRLPTDIKVELIERLANTGLTTIEATSFVSPKWVPQLADAKHVLSRIKATTKSKVNLPVLVPNVQGVVLAHQSNVKEVAVFVSATEGFSMKNIHCTVDESLVRVQKVMQAAKPLGIRVRGYVSCIFADPYDGPTKPTQVLRVTQALLDAGCYEVSLGDTLGVGTPYDVEQLLTVLFKTIPRHLLAGHFHDTYGQAIANVLKSYDMGIRTFDSSVAGLGGCPFARGAKGNAASEDLVYTFENMGVSTRVDLDRLVAVGSWISEQLGQPNGSRAGAALASRSIVQQSPAVLKPSRQRTWMTIESNSDFVVQRSGAALKIRLTRSKNGNSLTTAMIDGLTRVFTTTATDKSIFHVIICAEGKYFCTGMDLNSSLTPTQQFSRLRQLFDAIDSCPQTTIALINGPCFGGGVGLAFVCDIRIASPKATFRLTEVRLGICAATISKFLVREWGPSLARFAMLTGRQITAVELLPLHIVHKIIGQEDSTEMVADETLDELRHSAPRASTLSKDLVRWAWKDPGGEEQKRVIENAFEEVMADGSEGKIGFAEFKKGVKDVEWEQILNRQVGSKL